MEVSTARKKRPKFLVNHLVVTLILDLVTCIFVNYYFFSNIIIDDLNGTALEKMIAMGFQDEGG